MVKTEVDLGFANEFGAVDDITIWETIRRPEPDSDNGADDEAENDLEPQPVFDPSTFLDTGWDDNEIVETDFRNPTLRLLMDSVEVLDVTAVSFGRRDRSVTRYTKDENEEPDF